MVTAGYVLGLDLGKAQDPAAMVALRPRGSGAVVVGVKQWALGTDYVELLEDVRQLVRRVPSRPALAVDASGVGRSFCDFARRERLAAELLPVTITSGKRERLIDGCYRVPKATLTEALRRYVEGRRLRVAPGVTGAELLTRELRQYEVRRSRSGREVSGAFRRGEHDDLASACSLACWVLWRLFETTERRSA